MSGGLGSAFGDLADRRGILPRGHDARPVLRVGDRRAADEDPEDEQPEGGRQPRPGRVRPVAVVGRRVGRGVGRRRSDAGADVGRGVREAARARAPSSGSTRASSGLSGSFGIRTDSG